METTLEKMFALHNRVQAGLESNETADVVMEKAMDLVTATIKKNRYREDLSEISIIASGLLCPAYDFFVSRTRHVIPPLSMIMVMEELEKMIRILIPLAIVLYDELPETVENLKKKGEYPDYLTKRDRTTEG